MWSSYIYSDMEKSPKYMFKGEKSIAILCFFFIKEKGIE